MMQLIKLSAEYVDIGMICTSIEDTVLEEGVTVKGYKIFTRENDKEKFTSIYQGTDINESAELDIDINCDKIDYRVCILYSDGTVKISNIVSLEKQTDKEQGEEGNEIDSDGDGWTDFKEYQEGTDPWLKDSDFDGTSDRGDATPRQTNDYTRQTRVAEATVHKGLYDRKYSETIDDATYTCITNIYRGDIKQISIDYGDVSLNKVMKYFYDERGNRALLSAEQIL